MRPLIYLLLTGTACLLLQGAFLARPAWVAPARSQVAADGRYCQSLLPGESRTYVLDLAGHSRLQVRFQGSGSGLGLQVEDADGDRLRNQRLEDLPRLGRAWRGLLNPGDTQRTVRLTVHRPGGLAVHREVRHRPGPGQGDDPLEPGAYALDLIRDALP